MQEDRDWLDKPNEERNLTKYQRGLDTLLCTPWRTLEWKLWHEGLCSSEGIIPCVGCVGIGKTKLDRYCRGIHSSVVELTSLAILPLY